ncbi:thiamine pyrophosphate-dependent enzyme [Desulfovibrio sp. UCD-KL4C]|uniref:thiamine pyrophosphate-dependent enzyme n=1 Tax=Desulfovibrio sp. UCD-KL4C TaxID=2578120 RepID=UPI0025C34B16|nr:thiamine pyrophosphate-dependent enzyme [Desulfovibrio sp. UCD-KL4C]
MNRLDALKLIIEKHHDDPIVFSNGLTSREAAWLNDQENHMYLVHGMGEALSVGIGIAAAADTPVVVVDGDGNCLMGYSALNMLKNYNITYYVLDNGCYETTGGQDVSVCLDFPGLNRIKIEKGKKGTPNPPHPEITKNKFSNWLSNKMNTETI